MVSKGTVIKYHSELINQFTKKLNSSNVFYMGIDNNFGHCPTDET